MGRVRGCDDGPVTKPPRPTIYDVAARAGVSKSLVSLVLRDPASVSERRRGAVMEAIQELGYRPSAAAAALAGTRSRTVGMVVEDFANLWFVDLLHGMREVLEPHGLQVLMGDRRMSMAPGRDAIDAFVSMRVEALALALDPPDDLGNLHGIPTLVVGERGAQPAGIAKVAADDVAGARLATRHLIDLGHTVIAHVTGDGGAAGVRRASYEATMAEAGLTPVVIGHGGDTNEEAAAVAARGLLATRRDVTGDPGAVDDAAKVGALSLSLGTGWAKSLSFTTGQCPVMKYNRQLMMAILHDKVHIADAVNATAITLEDAPRGYAEFDAGAATKYVLDPHSYVSGS